METLNQAKFMFDRIRINGEREVKRVTLIFRASVNGWAASDFHRHCDNKGPTLCLFRSYKNYLASGFRSLSWGTEDVPDKSATLFSLTNELQAYNSGFLAYPHWGFEDRGPYFSYSLGLRGQKMNEENQGWCSVVPGFIRADEQGKNPLTGVGIRGYSFTCRELEVFALE